ncbi:MAG: biotin--[acetyl-CoA-carboxylase] ligase, partial [Burkholderiaceae bacterium]|nr:biotin--[acetyl-CoA-carboxylase] ligase [Burkholderiaceae bacterium]
MPAAFHLHWDADALWQRLEPLLPGLSVEVMARVGSTNTELLERMRRIPAVHGRVREGLDSAPGAARVSAGTQRGRGRRPADPQPCLRVAEHQSRGRGRQG